MWCWWLRPTSQTQMPVGADWGDQSKSSTLRPPGLARLVWTDVVIRLKVSWIQHQKGPDQRCLQHLQWQITQLLQKTSHLSHFLADTRSLFLTNLTLIKQQIHSDAIWARNEFLFSFLLVLFTNVTTKCYSSWLPMIAVSRVDLPSNMNEGFISATLIEAYHEGAVCPSYAPPMMTVLQQTLISTTSVSSLT